MCREITFNISPRKFENNSLVNMSLKLSLNFQVKRRKSIFRLLLWLLTYSKTEKKKKNFKKSENDIYLFPNNTLNRPLRCLQTNNSIFENVFHVVNYEDF